MNIDAMALALWNYFTDVELNNRGRVAYLKLYHHVDSTVNNCYCGYHHQKPETPIYNRAYVDRLFRDGMNEY